MSVDPTSRRWLGEAAERREQLAALARAIERDLTGRRREVFVAAALNDVPIDVLARPMTTLTRFADRFAAAAAVQDPGPQLRLRPVLSAPCVAQ